MKKSAFLFIAILFSGCIAKPVTKETTSGSINSSAPYMWGDQNFPKTLQISSDFSAAEVTNFTDMATAWELALENKVNFFDFGARTPEISSSVNNLDSLYDGVMGIYKTTSWPVDVSASALAVTQIFGRRHNVGSSSEYVSIEHADILINYDIHSFDTVDSGPGYDLRTVVLHEMGHFLGLQHRASSYPRSDSVMYPSIYSYETKRAPKSVDTADLAYKYSVSLSTALASSGAIVSDSVLPKYVPKDIGENVKILIELNRNGECIHKENGAEVRRHQIQLK